MNDNDHKFPDLNLGEIRRFLPKGSDIAGSATAGALGFLAAGPIGAAAASVAGPLLTAGLNCIGDMVNRSMSESEQARVAGVVALSVTKIREKLDSGIQPRVDDFFRIRLGSRPKAEEIFEGILLKSKHQYEERKVISYANLLAEVCFTEEISAEQCNLLLQILDRMTYMQLEILYALHQLGSHSPWQWNMIPKLQLKHASISLGIQELRNNHLVSPEYWGDSQVRITVLGNQMVTLTAFSETVGDSYLEIGRVIVDCAL